MKTDAAHRLFVRHNAPNGAQKLLVYLSHIPLRRAVLGRNQVMQFSRFAHQQAFFLQSAAGSGVNLV